MASLSLLSFPASGIAERRACSRESGEDVFPPPPSRSAVSPLSLFNLRMPTTGSMRSLSSGRAAAALLPAAFALLLLTLLAAPALSQSTSSNEASPSTAADENATTVEATTAEATTTTTTTTTLGCGALPRVEHATAQAAAGGLLPGESAVYACNTGYATPQGAAQWTLTCDLTGALSEIVPCIGTGDSRERGRGGEEGKEGGQGRKEQDEERRGAISQTPPRFFRLLLFSSSPPLFCVLCGCSALRSALGAAAVQILPEVYYCKGRYGPRQRVSGREGRERPQHECCSHASSSLAPSLLFLCLSYPSLTHTHTLSLSLRRHSPALPR